MFRRALLILIVLTSLCCGTHAWAQTTGSVTVTGVEQSTSGIWDLGSVTVTVNGYPETVSYGQFSTPASLASAIAAKFTSDCNSPANARSAPNGIVNFRTKNGATLATLGITESSSVSFSGSYSLGASITPTTTLASINATTLPSGGTAQVSAQVSCGVACGTVNYQLDGGAWLSGSLDTSGHFSATTSSSLAPGLHNVLVSFLGNDSFVPSISNPVSFTVLSGSLPAIPPVLYTYSIVQSDNVTSGYAPNGNILAYTDSVNGQWGWQSNAPIQYDSLNRLTGANQTVSGSTQYLCWGYDSFGNRKIQAISNQAFQTASPTCQAQSTASVTQVSANYDDGSNRITGNPSVTYDAAGNVKYDGTNSYLYDAEGRLCATASAPITGGTAITQYLYDAEGNRVAKGSAHTVFVSGQYVMSCDTSMNGYTETAGYVLGPNGEQMTEMDGGGNWVHTNVYAAGQLIATYDIPGIHFHLTDWLGSRRVQTDYTGNVQAAYSSLPYGEFVPSNTSQDLGATEQHFTGQERDTESGLDYFGARYYASAMGRFMSPDPSGLTFSDATNPQSLNQYSYVLNNPLINVDPSGLDCLYFNDAGTGLDTDANGNVTGIDHQSDSKKCGETGGDWVNGTTSANQVHYNAEADNFTVNSSDGDNSYHTNVSASGSQTSGVPCYGNCTESYFSSPNAQNVSLSIQQQFVPQMSRMSKALNTALPFPCGVGMNSMANIGPASYGFDVNTKRGAVPAGSLRLTRNRSGTSSVGMKGGKISGSVSISLPEAPELAITASTRSGAITNVGLAIKAPEDLGKVGFYILTGNMQSGCHP